MNEYTAEMIANFNRKITNLRQQLVNTQNQAAKGHIRSSIGILEVELATWRQM